MIRPWVFEFFPELKDGEKSASGPVVTAYFKRYLDLWVRDEALGFEGIFFSEHHFGYSFSPSPNLLIAATAVRTSKLRLGVMGVVVPYYAPTRIVEEVGMLDHISGGRLEIGTAIGVPQELSRVGLGMDEARALNDEALEVIDAAIDHGVVTHHGAHFNFDDLRLLPRPAQAKPPRWTTVVSEGSARKAARPGTKISTGFNTTEQIKALFDTYRDAAKTCGMPAGPEQLALRRRVAIAPSKVEAERLSAAAAERLGQLVAQDSRANVAAIPDAPNPKLNPKLTGGFSLTEDEFIAGTPDVVASKIISQCQRVGAGHFLAVLHWGAPFEEISAAHELFAREVIPALRKAKVG